METQALYDFAPIARLMLLGVVMALGPLAWVWVRNRHAPPAQRLRMLTLVTLFLTFDLVLFGAFTRLTDSGLGCPDWPGCYGSASPVGASSAIAAAQEAMPTGPVTFSKAWIEMIHRYLATAVGVLILVLASVSWVERRKLSVSYVWPLVTLIWVCLQGAFGALTVTMKLFPAIVTLHLLGGMALLALLRAQATGYALAAPGGPRPIPLHANTRLALGLVYGLLWIQIALGGWVSTNYAVLACSDFPMCQGSWWPDMDFQHGFSLWRELGQNRAGEAIAFPALTAIHYVHRLSAWVVFTALFWLVWRLWSVVALRPTARWLVGLALWQFASGLTNVVLDWPLLAAVGHTGGAAALVVVMTSAIFSTRTAHEPVDATAFTTSRPI
ncbi:MAG: COX15/CtaA family protein [Hydrogenophaga sp.]|uniref:COX15/CtaA family protein n=1 Tax=Hydrogenophaga sp. TaxID=1904254 RepID=UPI00271D78D7|nr:COX15/CtaA family protein [Hydrogenophaga sp.]MDO9479656.1 COX15/CtaA family protein [Hydrogenophaga sp.]MDP3346488.1 COX15/CtaA family protein [Hydrogenophaga sp.]MDP3807524.1 COX15/CtaA family protein [Hydrogenophaga sp.]